MAFSSFVSLGGREGIRIESHPFGTFERALVALAVGLFDVNERVLIAARVVLDQTVAVLVDLLEAVDGALEVDGFFLGLFGANDAGFERRDFQLIGHEANVAELEGDVILGAVFGKQSVEVGAEFLTGDFVERVVHDVGWFRFGFGYGKF